MQCPEFAFVETLAEADALRSHAFFKEHAQQSRARFARRDRGDEQLRVLHPQQQLGPQADYPGIELGYVVHGSESHMAQSQGRQNARLGHALGRRAIAPDALRHTQQPLAIAPFAPIRRIGVGIAQAIVHGAHAGGIRIAQKSHLQRRRFARKKQQPVAARVAGQIHQNVDCIALDQGCRLRIVQRADVAPAMPVHAQAGLGYGRIAIAADCIRTALVLLQEGMNEIGRRMSEKIGRHIADAQAALRLGCIGIIVILPNGIGQAPAPVEMLGGGGLGTGAVRKIEREQQTRARIGEIGRLGEAGAKRLNCVRRLAAGQQAQGEVVVQRGIAALERKSPAIRVHRLVQPAGLVRNIAEVQQRQDGTRRMRRSALEHGACFVVTAQGATARSELGQG